MASSEYTVRVRLFSFFGCLFSLFWVVFGHFAGQGAVTVEPPLVWIRFGFGSDSVCMRSGFGLDSVVIRIRSDSVRPGQFVIRFGLIRFGCDSIRFHPVVIRFGLIRFGSW